MQVGYQCEPALLQQAVGAFFSKLKKQWAPAAVVTLAVGLAGLGFTDPATWRRLLSAARKLLPSLNATGLQQLAWACATARQHEVGFCELLVEECMDRLDSFEVRWGEVQWGMREEGEVWGGRRGLGGGRGRGRGREEGNRTLGTGVWDLLVVSSWWRCAWTDLTALS